MAHPTVKLNRVINNTVEKLVINTVRCLGVDLTQEHTGGHPGTVMGAAAIGVALWRFAMRYNPKDPDWFNRDRFVLSAGHACLFQYIHLHLAGYDAWTADQLKTYHNPDFGMAAGHPEIEFPGIEVTTGPLGQGIANAVGLAIAAKNLAATYNKPGFNIVDHKIWCFTGDGCLQEGVGQEALSLAGHLRLDNFIVIYDDNQVTVDGSIANCFTDDSSAKIAANGFHIIEVQDGTNDLPAILEALDEAKTIEGKPIFVHIRTVIGYGSHRANSGAAHGQPLGVEEVEYVKDVFGFDPRVKCHIPDEVYEYFHPVVARGHEDEEQWKTLYMKYAEAYPGEYAEIQQRLTGTLPDGWRELLPTKSELPTVEQPTRKSSGIAVTTLVPKFKQFVAGSADLLESTFVSFPNQVEFQHPDTGLGDYSGRQIRYGIREFAMIGISNGMSAYQNGMFIPICSTFFQFWLYAAPAARMSALQGLRIIGIGTHDSIGIGEDGPTHQPIALASFYRSLPNYNFIRPADAEECMGAWEIALDSPHTPSLFALSRQPVPLHEHSDRSKVKLGAYPIFSTSSDDSCPQLVIISSGSEVTRSIEAAKRLGDELNLRVRVVSMPSQAHFDKQSYEYHDFVLGNGKALVVAIEAWSSYGWARYAHASLSMHTFGQSAPQTTLYKIFGFGVDNIVAKVKEWVDSKTLDGEVVLPRLGQFEELLLGYVDVHKHRF